MPADPRFALVAYIRSPLGEFIERLHLDLHPAAHNFSAHVTILPPRCLNSSVEEAIATLSGASRDVSPFAITLGDIESFVPITPTVFIRVAHAAYRMRELHDQLNSDGLATLEQWPYMPHVTIAKLNNEQEAAEGLRVARERWAQFEGERNVTIGELTLVREDGLNRWVDMARFPLINKAE